MRAAIIEGLLAGKSLRAVGNSVTPPVHHVVLHKYRQKHIQPTLDGANSLSNALKALAENSGGNSVAIDPITATRAALLADPLRARIAQHQAVVDRSLVKAESDGDGRTVAALIGTDLKGLELDARLSGRLDSAQTTTVHYVMAPTIQITVAGVESRNEQVTIDVQPDHGQSDT